MEWTLAAAGGIQLTAALAPILGALHALEPGHGKSLVAAYLVGSSGRILDAVLLGVTVTLTHTGAAIGLGLLVVLLGDRVQGPAARQAMQIIAASLVVVIGAWMFYSLLRGRLGRHLGHDHGDDHGHHHHNADAGPGAGSGRRAVFGRGGLIGLGVSGGLIPCPAALAVVLGVLHRGSPWSALGTVLLFSAGMGAVLTALAVAVVKFRSAAEKRVAPRFVRHLPAISAALVTLLGVGLLVTAIWFPGALDEAGGHAGHAH